MIDLIKGKEVLVIGMARSGLAAVELLISGGAASVTITDQKDAASLQEPLQKLSRLAQVKTAVGGNPIQLVSKDLSLIVTSPGVPPRLDLFRKAEELGIPVISEIELAYTFLKTPLIGITGTNGKTTTTALITAMLREAGIKPVEAAGNIGTPLSNLAGKFSAQGYIVAELSSFQLDRISAFRPYIALVLNFAPDHIDYHGSEEAYYRAKSRIIENQLPGDITILNAGDQSVARLAGQSRGKLVWFDRRPVECGAGLEGDWLVIYNPGSEPQKICRAAEIALPGEHNLENSLAAAAAAWSAGADGPAIARTLCTFKALEHRLEHFLQRNGIDYINDSKGTNPGSTIRALQSFPGRSLVLLAGGMDKGADFAALSEVIKQKVKKVIIFGETKAKIAASLEQAGYYSYSVAADLEEAVTEAEQAAEPGDLVLLSPACASWDMFSDYEERGRIFKNLVQKLQQES